jgi:hypothetical protein
MVVLNDKFVSHNDHFGQVGEAVENAGFGTHSRTSIF